MDSHFGNLNISSTSPRLSSVRSSFSDIGARLHEENASNAKEKGLMLDFSRSKRDCGSEPSSLSGLDSHVADTAILRHRQRPVIDLQLTPDSSSPSRRVNRAEMDSRMNEIKLLNGVLTIDGVRYETRPDDLQHLGELGTGSCGHVVKMLHKPSGRILAVKQMRRSGNAEEIKRIIMDLDVVLKSHDCPYIVQCLGCFVTDADVWICMELMTTCLDKLLKKLANRPFPEPIIGKIAVAMVSALHYLKDTHGVIHRDVKPSNILLDNVGQVKLCDFGISGRLVDSKAKTRTAGSAAYMAPERIEPPDPSRPDYDIRADVWSMGITLVELATGIMPYSECKSEFEALTKVLEDRSPSLPHTMGFSREFRSFVDECLIKNYKLRPKYRRLLEHEFIRKSDRDRVDVAAWFSDVQAQVSGIKTPVTRRRTPPPHSPHQKYVRARRAPEPDKFRPELWAPRGRFCERSGLYSFLGMSASGGNAGRSSSGLNAAARADDSSTERASQAIGPSATRHSSESLLSPTLLRCRFSSSPSCARPPAVYLAGSSSGGGGGGGSVSTASEGTSTLTDSRSNGVDDSLVQCSSSGSSVQSRGFFTPQPYRKLLGRHQRVQHMPGWN